VPPLLLKVLLPLQLLLKSLVRYTLLLLPLLLKVLIGATIVIASILPPNSHNVIINIALGLNFGGTDFVDAALEFETSGFDFANASQATIAGPSCAPTTNASHANSSKGKLPVWRASTSRTMGGEVFPTQGSLTFATLDEYGFLE